MIVKSILQWRERQSESFGERILQALKDLVDPPLHTAHAYSIRDRIAVL